MKKRENERLIGDKLKSQKKVFKKVLTKGNIFVIMCKVKNHNTILLEETFNVNLFC